MEKAHAVVSYHSHSAKRTQELKDAQKEMNVLQTLKVLKDVPTRWNSRFELLKRLVVLAPAMSKYLPRHLIFTVDDMLVIGDVSAFCSADDSY